MSTMQNDRKLHELSEYIIGFKKVYFNSDSIFETQMDTIFSKSIYDPRG